MLRRTLLTAVPAALACSRLSFGSTQTRLRIANATLHVHFPNGQEPEEGRALIARWVERSAEAVAAYFGRFPIATVHVAIALGSGSGVRGGQTYAIGGEVFISVRLGRSSSEEDLLTRDWVMVHEMIHTAHPQLPRSYFWFCEGMAVYVESVCRVRAGHLAVETVLRDFMRDMPKGMPEEGDQGLDHTPTWGRTYWGGAMLFLLADVEIRKATQNRLGLVDSLRAMNQRYNYADTMSDVSELLDIGDAATGTAVLTALHREMGSRSVAPDLDGLWHELGVGAKGGRVTIDDTAVLAPIRKAIFARVS